MSDRRQRARVQGSWARQVPRPRGGGGGGGPAGSAASNHQHAHSSVAPMSAVWKSGNHRPPETFEFQQPEKPVREVPAEKVIDQPGDHIISHRPSGLSRLRLLPGFLPPEEADWIFSRLLAELPWSQKTNYRQGEAYEEPRLTCWFGQLPYSYSNSTLAANSKWHPLLVNLHETVTRACSSRFNSLLCNLYRDGHDSIGWHSDDEASLGAEPTIASVSLGDTRVFSLRKKPPPEEGGDFTYMERLRVPLAHGTLLIMSGSTQDDWQHQVAKEYHDRGPRINLTFRTIHAEPEGHRPGTKLRFTAQKKP